MFSPAIKKIMPLKEEATFATRGIKNFKKTIFKGLLQAE